MALTQLKTGAIADDAVTTDKLANAINTARDANTAKTTNATHSGDVTGSGALTIANDAVTSAKIADDAITSALIADNAVVTAAINADAVTGAKIADNAINSEHYTDGSIDHVHLAADAVDGDNIADDSINSEHYVDGSIDTAHIADSQVTTAKIATDAVTSAKIADNAVVTARINDAAVTNAKLADDSVNGSKIAAGAINNANKLQDSIVTGAKIGSGTIVAGNLATDSVTTAKIANNAVTADKLPNAEVTFAKITDIPQNRIAGRISSGSGVMQELTAANVRTMINVEDGATAGGGGLVKVASRRYYGFDQTTGIGNAGFTKITKAFVTITPSSSSNSIRLSGTMNWSGSDTEHQYSFRWRREISGGATTSLDSDMGSGNRPGVQTRLIGNGDLATVSLGPVIDQPSTTSAITYYIETFCDGGNQSLYLNRSQQDHNDPASERAASYFIAEELDNSIHTHTNTNS